MVRMIEGVLSPLGRGHRHNETNRHTDIATFILNCLRGLFNENNLNLGVLNEVIK